MSFAMSVLILFANGYSLTTKGFYISEQPFWQLQCYGQDLINVTLVVPALMISALLVFNRKNTGLLIWPGVVLYLIYTFVIYCFDVRFNALFVEYCLILGLCVYSMLFFLYVYLRLRPQRVYAKSGLNRFIAVFFLCIGVVFSTLWLSEIIPAVNTHSIPINLHNSGLATNPVHVLDLSFILPLFIITGVLLLRNKNMGYALTPWLLVFSTLMNFTILALNLIMKASPALTITFAVLTVFTLVLLILFMRRHFKHRQLSLPIT